MTLAEITERGGERYTKLLFSRAIEALIIKPEDIPEAYWKQQKQLMRDNGRGDVNLSDRQKRRLTDELQSAQRTGLESWSSYLQHEVKNYPKWFLLYAWDGMSKLGSFDQAKGVYRKRSAGTVNPYPKLSPAALAQTYDVLSKRFSQEKIEDEHLAKLAKGGNFNNIYSYFLLNTGNIIPTPENSDDVHGEWKEYGPNDIEALTKAAQSTPWCIAGERHAKRYLDVRDGVGDEDDNSRARFFLFHLKNPETNQESPTACASIRLNSDGNVAEISGLKGGSSQYLEDSLVPTVETKVRTLPGGESYLEAFADKQKLIAMDKKFQKGETFSLEELEFIYEVSKPIKYIDTYDEDPRPAEFKKYKTEEHLDILSQKYGKNVDLIISNDEIDDWEIESLLAAGYDVDVIAARSNLGWRAEKVPRLLEVGANPNGLLPRLKSYEIEDSLKQLLEAGADVVTLVSSLEPSQITKNLDQLIKYGAEIDIDELVPELNFDEAAKSLPQLNRAGANINVDEFVSQLSEESVCFSLPELLEAGAKIDVNELMSGLDGFNLNYYEYYVHNLVRVGVDTDGLVSRLSSDSINERFNFLYDSGANVDKMVAKLSDDGKAKHLTKIIQAGVEVDVNDLVSKLHPYDIAANLPQLIKAGAEIDFAKVYYYHDAKFKSRWDDEEEIFQILSKLPRDGFSEQKILQLVRQCTHYAFVSENFPKFLEAGFSLQAIVDHRDDLSLAAMAANLTSLTNMGIKIDVDKLVSSLGGQYKHIFKNLSELLQAGADVNILINSLDAHFVACHSTELLQAGLSQELISSRLNDRFDPKAAEAQKESFSVREIFGLGPEPSEAGEAF